MELIMLYELLIMFVFIISSTQSKLKYKAVLSVTHKAAFGIDDLTHYPSNIQYCAKVLNHSSFLYIEVGVGLYTTVVVWLLSFL